jgi:hypothetical protein
MPRTLERYLHSLGVGYNEFFRDVPLKHRTKRVQRTSEEEIAEAERQMLLGQLRRYGLEMEAELAKKKQESEEENKRTERG